MRHVEWLGATTLEEDLKKDQRRTVMPYLLWGGIAATTLWIFFKTIGPVKS